MNVLCSNLITIRTARVTFKVNFVVFLSPHVGFSSMQIVHKNSYLVKLQDIHGQIALWEVCKWKNCSLTICMQQSKRNCSCCIEGQKKKQAESQVNERPSKHPQVWIYFLLKKEQKPKKNDTTKSSHSHDMQKYKNAFVPSKVLEISL